MEGKYGEEKDEEEKHDDDKKETEVNGRGWMRRKMC